MTSKERVIRALEFKEPDKIPLDMWVLPAAKMEYGEKLDELSAKYPRDIASVSGPHDHGFTKEYYTPGSFVDPWGSRWENIQAGIIGEVKDPVFKDYSTMEGFIPPVDSFLEQWEAAEESIAQQIAAHRSDEKFIIGGWLSIFERMQYLRGTEELYVDLALGEEALFQMAEHIMNFFSAYLDKWLAMDIDGVAFGDDWGTQISLLISPNSWREIFKPMYKILIDRIKAAGKKVFFHSDGFIFDLYEDFIQLGVDAINSQLWIMDIEEIGKKFAGRITFWGEISRQTTLPNGTPEEIKKNAETMKKLLCVNGGGLIGESEINKDVPLENIEAFLKAWND